MTMNGDAWFSGDRRYRYLLTRQWNAGTATVNFIGLNPSTADETVDDPTIRRCIRFARDWGYARMVMTNLFAYRATDWHELRRVVDPVGPDNLRHVLDQARNARTVVAAWGAHGPEVVKGDVVPQFVDMLVSNGVLAKCLGRTRSGQPRHPLFLLTTTQPVPFWPEEPQ